MQIWVTVLTFVMQAVYLLNFRPFESLKMQRLEIFNEVCSTCLIYALICFSGANLSLARQEAEDPSLTSFEGELEYDLIFFAIMGINLFVHLSLLLKESIIALKSKIVAKCCRKKTHTLKMNPKTNSMTTNQSTELQSASKKDSYVELVLVKPENTG